MMKHIYILAACFTVLMACQGKPVDRQFQDEFQSSFQGAYEVVSIRKPSDVAAPATPISQEDNPVGRTITFSASGVLMEGLDCDGWTISELAEPVININDPILADINIAPVEADHSAGDQRVLKSFAVNCEGEAFLNVLKVDDRVLVIPWANSAQYLIAEAPLSSAQIKQFQKSLRSMKFYEGPLSGEIDDATRQAIGSWAEYRSGKADDYRFYRPAITENLLDTLNILEASDENK